MHLNNPGKTQRYYSVILNDPYIENLCCYYQKQRIRFSWWLFFLIQRTAQMLLYHEILFMLYLPLAPMTFNIVPPGRITGRQKIRAITNSVRNEIMLIHTKTVLFQFHIILLNWGSSDSMRSAAAYISGIPKPGSYFALCSIVTLKQAVGSYPSVKSMTPIFRFWTSDWKPVIRGRLLNMVSTNLIGWLLNCSMVG